MSSSNFLTHAFTVMLVSIMLMLADDVSGRSSRVLEDRVAGFARVSVNVIDGAANDLPQSLRLRFQVDGDKVYTLALVRSDELMSGGYASMQQNADGSFATASGHPQNCYYHGTVEGEADSSVSLSICHGADGMIHTSGVSFVLEPVTAPTGGSVLDRLAVEHAFYRLEDDSDSEELHCGTADPVSMLALPKNKRRSAMAGIRRKRLTKRSAVLQQSDTNTADMLIFNDFLRIQRFNGDTSAAEADTLAVINQLNTLYGGGQFIEPLVMRVVGQINFQMQNPFEPATTVAGEFSGSTLLNNFRTYHQANLNTFPDHDNAHMFSAIPFTGSTVGVAFVGTFCRNLGANVGVDELRFSTALNAVLVAHELGHNYGFRHDDSQGCPGGFIMAPSLSGAANMFSDCSRSVMDTFLGGDQSQCIVGQGAAPTTTTQGQTTTQDPMGTTDMPSTNPGPTTSSQTTIPNQTTTRSGTMTGPTTTTTNSPQTPGPTNVIPVNDTSSAVSLSSMVALMLSLGISLTFV